MRKRGDQIIYVPLHAEGDTSHPDCEAGFVTGYAVKLDLVYCRFWSKRYPGQLRTTANSESVPVDRVVWQDTVPQEQVEKQLDEIYGEDRELVWW